MSKKIYDNSTVIAFPNGFSMELPDGYRIDTEYDEEGNQIAHLRGGFYINDEGDEDFDFAGSFLSLNVDLKVNDDADPQARENLRDPSHKDFAFNQVIEGLKGNLEEQYGPGKCIKLYKSSPVSAILKYYQPFSIFGVTLDTYLLFYWVEVNESTVFGFTSVYQSGSASSESYHKHLLNAIKSVRVDGKSVDIGKLTPKKLEKALDLEAGEDAEAMDLGLSIGVNIKNGDEETKYTINSDGSVTSETIEDGISYTSPDESLYPHYNSMLQHQGLGMLGAIVVVNQSGTEYKFYNLENDLDEDAPDEIRNAVAKISDNGASQYKLADRASEMRTVFHVSSDIFDMSRDRECELAEGYMHRAYMMSAIRSFAWTLTKYCKSKKIQPKDIDLAQIQQIIDEVADRDWLNYDDKSECKGLCATQDLHVYYLPDSTPENIKEVFRPSKEILYEIKRVQENFPAYNPIPDQIGSLDALRKDLSYIYPAIEKIYEDLKKNRDYNEPLVSRDADVLYAWCALAYAARAPFYSEDGPTINLFRQIETGEEKNARIENMREENEKKLLDQFGQFYEINPHIEFKDKKFVFSGIWYPDRDEEAEPDYKALIEKKGGLIRSNISGVTDYLVVDFAGNSEWGINSAIEKQKEGKPVKIIKIDDLKKALGLLVDEKIPSAEAVESTPKSVAREKSEETVIVDGMWAVTVPAGFIYCTDKNIIGNHRNIIIMEDKPGNDFDDPFGATISFTSLFNKSENDGIDGVAMAKMMIGIMGAKDNKVVKDD